MTIADIPIPDHEPCRGQVLALIEKQRETLGKVLELRRENAVLSEIATAMLDPTATLLKLVGDESVPEEVAVRRIRNLRQGRPLYEGEGEKS